MVLQRSALPTVYSTSEEEYLALTTASGLHNASYMGRLKATGDDGLDLLNRLSTNKVIDLTAGQGAPTILTTDRGRILDLIGVVNADEYILLITSPGAQQQVIDFLDKYTIMEDLTVEDITEESSMFSVLGPNSQAAIESASGKTLGDLPTYHSLTVEIGGHEVRIVHRPFGDLPSYDMLMDSDATTGVWDYLTASGITPVGEEAFEAARLNYSVPEYGREISEAYNPLEAGLIGSIDFAKGCYIGQEVIARLDTYQKIQKHLVRLEFSEGAAVAEGDVLTDAGQEVGKVTSVTNIPTGLGLVGMAYIRKASASPGKVLELVAPSSGQAEITALPQLFGPGQE
jgi:folate-binding protein YgfZ